MMLWTAPLEPASCEAIEPQKFSAAATRTAPEGPGGVEPQPLKSAAAAAAAAIADRALMARSPYHALGLSLIPIGYPWMSMAATWSDHVHAVLARAGHQRGGARERVIDLLARQPC